MQFSLQVYISELAPTARIRGTLLSCYNLWFVIQSIQRMDTDSQVDTWAFHWDDRYHNGGSTGSQQLDHHRSHPVGPGRPDGNYLRLHSRITL